MSQSNDEFSYENILRKKKGLLDIKIKVSVRDSECLSMVYTPGVATPCLDIQKDITRAYELTNKGNAIIVLTDSSAITKEKVCFGNKLCTFNPISINYKFLYYYLQSPLFLSAFNNSLSGIITGVSLNKIKELNFVIPPIEEQQRIVETLDRLLPLCEAL